MVLVQSLDKTLTLKSPLIIPRSHLSHTEERQMPSIRKRNGLWQAQVRKRNTGSISKSFHRKSDATKWALQQEITLQSGSLISKQRDDHTLNCLMNRYLEEVTPHKRGKEQEGRHIKRLRNDNKLMRTFLRAARPPVFASFRDTRIHDGVRACQVRE